MAGEESRSLADKGERGVGACGAVEAEREVINIGGDGRSLNARKGAVTRTRLGQPNLLTETRRHAIPKV